MKTVPILDQGTFDQVIRAVERARWTGRTIPDTLHMRGLLWTPDRERQVRADAIKFIHDEMSTWAPHEFLRRRNKALANATPTDMYMGILEWMREHVAHARTGS